MDNRGARQGIAEVMEEAYARRQALQERPPRWWRVRTRIVVMTIICTAVGSLIAYWFVSSIVENRRDHRGQSLGSSKPSYLNRLPTRVLPLEYTLKILPIIEEGNFTAHGEVLIHLHCKAPTRHVRLHAHKLLISEVTLGQFHYANASKMINEYHLTDDEFVDIFLLQVLMPGESYLLRIKYTLPLDQEPRGLFRSSYVDSGANETRWIVVSNFSPDYARRAFPCFDEPWIKVPFRISIGRKSEMTSHSNSLRKITTDIYNMPGYVWDHYEKTLPMSTYLVAFMVTDFPGYRVNVTDKPYHTFFARRGLQGGMEYFGYLIPRLLRVIQNFTGFYYEPDKLDVIMVPTLPYSGMENWGLITLLESDAVLKNDSGFAESKKLFDSICGHEVAHQWFGNLVTPKWWSDVWLKEGFSSFFGHLALSVIDPTWSLDAVYTAEFREVFESEGSERAHPLRINLTSLKRLDGVFDETTYVKGNCVVYMIFHFLGKPAFLSSVHRYLQAHYYRSAGQEEVWNAFQEEILSRDSPNADWNMTETMRTWTDQAGYPVVQLQRNVKSGAVVLTQDRFYNHGLNSTSRELWYIPLTWTTDSERRFDNGLPKAWMTQKYMEINDQRLRRAIFSEQWILFNVGQTGLYRVNYDIENWGLLTKSFKGLPQVTKAQLLADAFAAANAGLLNHTVPWDILQNLETETGELLWTAALSAFKFVKYRLADSPAFKFVMCKILDKAYRTSSALPWTRFRIGMMKLTCLVGHRTCLKMARDLTLKTLLDASTSSVTVEHRTWIYCVYMTMITEDEWSKLLEEYKFAEESDKESLAYALGCHRDKRLLKRYLSLATEANYTEEKYADLAFISIASNPHGYKFVMESFPSYWQRINGLSSGSLEPKTDKNNVVAGMIYGLSKNMNQEENIQWLRRLKGVNENYDIIIEEAIDKVRSNLAWSKSHRAQTLKILNNIFEHQQETKDCKKE
ncbi:hypothetical protein KM043_016642 [Ampulex compressa]|nr:hypothetical protein KM043_016642 [Ampulex compressa]